jgi:DNA-binding transcriptional ArsR family regulator
LTSDTAQQKLAATAQIFKALAHPARLQVVEELARGERCVCELQAVVGSDMSTVSRHLAVLRNTGVVSDEKRGNQVFYSLKIPCIMDMFSCIDSVLNERRRQTPLGLE